MSLSAVPPKSLDELTLGSDMSLEELVSRDGLGEVIKSANELFGVPIRVFTEDGKLLADAADSIEIYAYLNTSRAGRAALSAAARPPGLMPPRCAAKVELEP